MSNIYNFTAAYNEATESVELSWDVNLDENIEGEVAYFIYKDWEQHDIIPGLTYKDSSIYPKATYLYQVALLVNGEEVTWSDKIEVTIPQNNNLLIYTSKGHYNEIAKRIKRKLGSNGFPIKPHQMPFKIKEVYQKGQEIGKQAERDTFWDNFQDNGNRRAYPYGFYRGYWGRGNTFNPKYPIQCDDLESGISGSGIRMFQNNTDIKEINQIIEIVNSGGSTQVFAGASNLWKILLLRVNSTTRAYTNWFTGDSSLVFLRWDGEIAYDVDLGECPLDKDSIDDTIKHLSATVTGKTLTLNKSAVDTAYETSQGANNGSTSSKWDEIKASVSNWTITLSGK